MNQAQRWFKRHACWQLLRGRFWARPGQATLLTPHRQRALRSPNPLLLLLPAPFLSSNYNPQNSLALVHKPQLQLEGLLAAASAECVQGPAERQVQVLLRYLWHQLLCKLNSKLTDLLQHILLLAMQREGLGVLERGRDPAPGCPVHTAATSDTQRAITDSSQQPLYITALAELSCCVLRRCC